MVFLQQFLYARSEVFFEKHASSRITHADLIQAQLIGRFVKVLGELANNLHIRPCRILGVITTLEFLQHHLS
jgi:hypothetical protein